MVWAVSFRTCSCLDILPLPHAQRTGARQPGLCYLETWAYITFPLFKMIFLGVVLQWWELTNDRLGDKILSASHLNVCNLGASCLISSIFILLLLNCNHWPFCWKDTEFLPFGFPLGHLELICDYCLCIFKATSSTKQKTPWGQAFCWESTSTLVLQSHSTFKGSQKMIF